MQLSGNIPNSIGNMTGLQYLCAAPRRAVCPLSHKGPRLYSVLYSRSMLPPSPHVTSLLSGNLLTGTVPSSIGNLTSLTYLCARLRTAAHAPRESQLPRPLLAGTWATTS